MSLYAVIQTGGKQYRVNPGEVIQVEKLEGEVGSTLGFNEVLFVSKPSTENSQVWMGKPLLSGATVQGEIVGQGRGEKIYIVKVRRRKNYRRKQGHRQEYTQLLITSIANGAGETAELSAQDKKEKLAQFQSHLKARGEAPRPKQRSQTSGLNLKSVGSDETSAPAQKSAKSAAPKKAAVQKSATTATSKKAPASKKSKQF